MVAPSRRGGQSRHLNWWRSNSMNATTKWLAAAALAMTLASGHLLSAGPTELETIEAVQADVQDAIKTAQAEQ